MGTGARAGGNRRAGRLLAAAAGATVVAAGAAAGAVAARRQRQRRQAPISPDESLAGPAGDLRLTPAPAPAEAPGPPPLARRRSAPADEDGRAVDLARSGDSLGAPVIDIRRRARGRADAAGAPDDRDPGDRAADAFRLAEALTTTAPPAATNGHGPRTRPAGTPPGDASRPPVGPEGPRDTAITPAAVPADPGRRFAVDATRRRPSAPAIAVVAAVLVLAAGALVVGLSGDDAPTRAEVAGEIPATGADTTTTALAPLSAADAFAAAGRRLTSAGSFSYRGTASASDVSDVRPTLWLAVDVTVDGQVTTSTSRLHEIATTADLQATETVADGPRVWSRRAATPESLAGQAYESLPALSAGARPARGAALLPTWLAAAAGAVDAGVDPQGRHVYQATIPASALGVIERDRPAVDATVVLTLDGANDPARVEITAAPGGPTLHLAYDISGIGTPVLIDTPA